MASRRPPLELSTYENALFRARVLIDRLDALVILRIGRALERFADRLEAGIETMPASRRAALEHSQQVVRFAAAELATNLERATAESRDIAFRETLAVWREAGERVAQASGVPAALLGAVRRPPITMLAAWDAVGSPRTWRSLMRQHIADGAQEVSEIMRLAIAEEVGPEELARRLRRYVVGADKARDFFGPDGKIDLRRLPLRIRGAAFEMRHNAERIAVTELHQARGEAEIQQFSADPFIAAVRRTLAPNRGRVRIPDVCDVLARTDFYGLGPGVYPIDKAPPIAAHPWDRCEYMPVVRPAEEITRPKPSPGRRIIATRLRMSGARRADLKRAEMALQFGEESAREREARRRSAG